MIEVTAILALSGLAGWLIGLAVHGLCVARWRDSGARVTWGTGAGAGAAIALIVSLGLSVADEPTVFLLVVGLAVGAGGASAWRANGLLGFSAKTGGADRDVSCHAHRRGLWRAWRSLRRNVRDPRDAR